MREWVDGRKSNRKSEEKKEGKRKKEKSDNTSIKRGNFYRVNCSPKVLYIRNVHFTKIPKIMFAEKVSGGGSHSFEIMRRADKEILVGARDGGESCTDDVERSGRRRFEGGRRVRERGRGKRGERKGGGREGEIRGSRGWRKRKNLKSKGTGDQAKI